MNKCKFSFCTVSTESGLKNVWVPAKLAKQGTRLWVRRVNVEEPEEIKNTLSSLYWESGIVRNVKPLVDGSGFSSEQLNQVFGKHNV